MVLLGSTLELAKFFMTYGYAALEWVLVALVIVLIVYCVPKITPPCVEWIHSRAEAKLAEAEARGEGNEILRANTAALEACSAVIEMNKQDRERQCEAIYSHDAKSVERLKNVQDSVEVLTHEIGKARGEIGILLDRTN